MRWSSRREPRPRNGSAAWRSSRCGSSRTPQRACRRPTAPLPNDDAIRGSLGHLYAISGQEAKARRLISELTTRPDTRGVAFFVALIYAGLHDTDAALTWLERAVDERSGSIRYLKVDPRLGEVRQDPRYRRLMERVGLPQ